MKKILFITSILIAAVMLSSCVFYGFDRTVTVTTKTTPVQKHSMTLSNQTSYDVEDWYCKDTSGKKYTFGNDPYPVLSGHQSTMTGLPVTYYHVIFTFDYYCTRDSYRTSNEVYLNRDYEYVLEERVITVSSAARNASETVQKKEFVLVGSDGSETVLIPYTEEEE